MMKASRLQTPLAMVLAGVWAAALAFGHNRGDVGFLDRLEATLTDLRIQIRGVKKPPDLVTIIAIDDRVAREQGSYPLPRATLTTIIEEIARYKPKVLALDLLLVDAGAAESDAALAQALGKTKHTSLPRRRCSASPNRPWPPRSPGRLRICRWRRDFCCR